MQSQQKTNERQVRVAEEKINKFGGLALERGVKLLSKKKLTPKDYLELKLLTKIISDVNEYLIQFLTLRRYKSQSGVPVCSAQPSQQKSEGNSTGSRAE